MTKPICWQLRSGRAEDGSITLAPVCEEKSVRTNVALNLKRIQSVFVVFRKPATGEVHLTSVSVSDSTVQWDIFMEEDGNASICSNDQISTEAAFSSGKTNAIEKREIELNGDWMVSFTPKNDEPFENNISGADRFQQIS